MNYKKLLFVALTFLTITAAISCKKEDEPFKDAFSNTTWVGTVTSNNTSGNIAIQFGEDTKVTLLFGGLNAPASSQYSGTYTYANNIVLFSIRDPQNVAVRFSFSGTLNANKIDGTYGGNAATEGVGTFSVTKQ